MNLLSTWSARMRWPYVFVLALLAIAAAVIVVIARLARKLYSVPWAIALGLLLGGALGNLIDRLAAGAVTDFLKLPKWPAFNVADIAITFGVLALLYVLEGPPRRAEAD